MNGDMKRSNVAQMEEALLRMRRLWAHSMRPEALAGEFRGRVEISHVLIVDAVRRVSAPGEEVTVRRIAEQLDVERSTASRLVDSAARAGWVHTGPSTADARRTVVDLTANGQALDERARAFRLDYLTGLLDDWADDDIADLARLLNAFSNLVAENPPKPDGGNSTNRT